MRLTLLGVRGSTPAPGGEFVRYGGHTCCVAVGPDDGPPGLVLDAGTGLRALGRLLDGAPFRGDIVLTHLHWDHVQGLPFCPSIDRPGAEVRLHVPVRDHTEDPLAVLRRGMSPPQFPIGPDELVGDWEFVPLLTGPVKLVDDRIDVSAERIRHKGGATYGLRVAGRDGRAAAYLPDHLLTAPGDLDGHHLVSGVDVLLHDSQFTRDEGVLAAAFGHSTIDVVTAYADDCGVGRLELLHHHPDRTDAALDDLGSRLAHTPGGRPVRFAAQDDVIDLR